MNRRSFLAWLGAAAVAVPVVKQVVSAVPPVVNGFTPVPSWPLHKPSYISYHGQYAPSWGNPDAYFPPLRSKVFFVTNKAESDAALKYSGGPKMIIPLPSKV